MKKYVMFDEDGVVGDFDTLEEGWAMCRTEYGPLSHKPQCLEDLDEGLSYFRIWIEKSEKWLSEGGLLRPVEVTVTYHG